MIGWKLKALAGVSAALVLTAAGWAWHSDRQELASVTGQLSESQDDLEKSESARWQEHASSMRIYFNEQSRIQELEDEKARLAERLASDAIGLRINAECPGLPEDTAAPGQSYAPTPRLTDSAERDYRTLRERVIEQRSQVIGLQRYIREECPDTKKDPTD